MMDKVSVTSSALRELLEALTGPPYLIRELQAIRSITDSPIDLLIREYNEQVETFNDAQVREDKQ